MCGWPYINSLAIRKDAAMAEDIIDVFAAWSADQHPTINVRCTLATELSSKASASLCKT
jgi:F0F1-type ATP synthase delta subunit